MTKSNMEKAIEEMAGEQFEALKSMVDAEAQKRGGDIDRVATMNDREFQDLAMQLANDYERGERQQPPPGVVVEPASDKRGKGDG